MSFQTDPGTQARLAEPPGTSPRRHRGKAAQADTSSELRLLLAGFSGRLKLRDSLLLAQHSLWLAGLCAVLAQVAGRLWAVDRLWQWTCLPLLVWLLAVAANLLFRPVPLLAAARRVDAELGLKERLATAFVLEQAGKATTQSAFRPDLVSRQRQDALKTAQDIDARRSLPMRWAWRSLALASALGLTALILALLPNPMDRVLAERAAVAVAIEEQADRVEQLRREVEEARELTPEEREALLRQLAELAARLRADAEDRQDALADLSRAEEALRQNVSPDAETRQAALQELGAQLEALAKQAVGDPAPGPAEALEMLSQGLPNMGQPQREQVARALGQMAARAAQAGDMNLAQALSALSQAAQAGDGEALSQAAGAASEALDSAQAKVAAQAVLRQVLSTLQSSQQAIARAGTGQGAQARAAGAAQGQSQGQGQGQSQGQGQGQGQGRPGGGGGTKADRLPPGSSAGQAQPPQGQGQAGNVIDPGQQIYVPWDRRQGSGEEMYIPGQESGQGETQVREETQPLPGTPGQALVPYHEVYRTYLDAANQTIEQSYIPSGLKDYVRSYFSQLEP